MLDKHPAFKSHDKHAFPKSLDTHSPLTKPSINPNINISNKIILDLRFFREKFFPKKELETNNL